MYHPETHRRVHRERGADFLRAAHKSELAAAVAESRTSERRFYLAHLWEKRFGKSPRPAADPS